MRLQNQSTEVSYGKAYIEKETEEAHAQFELKKKSATDDERWKS